MCKETCKPETFDVTWPVVLIVTGITLMRSEFVAIKSIGALLVTLNLIRTIKKLSTLA
ncbi:Transposase [Citrobacter portucalensis]